MEDHCKAIDLVIHKGRVGEVYNIGGHNEMKNIDIVKIICKALDKPESLITYVTDRKGHDMRYAIDPTKIHNELGWLPETKFADGIQKTIRWTTENGGKRSFPANIRIIMRKCTKTGKYCPFFNNTNPDTGRTVSDPESVENTKQNFIRRNTA